MKLAIKAELVYIVCTRDAGHRQYRGVAIERSDRHFGIAGRSAPDPTAVRQDARPGDRSIRAALSGEVTILYQAVVENNLRQLLPTSGQQHLWSDLPNDVLPFLLPSRFCPSDKFMRFAQREFGGAGDGVARVMAILEWIHRNVDYVPGVSNAETTAERTFVDRAGVCRDFTHLAITLSRALGIPARAVSAYALQLEPPDFHAIFEVFLDNNWWLIDPTRLAPIEGIVRIGCGRDASDIAFLTSDKQCQVLRQTIAVSNVR